MDELEQTKLFPDIGQSEDVNDAELAEQDADEVEVDPAQEKIKELEERLNKKEEEFSNLNNQMLQVMSRPPEQVQTQQEEQDEKLPDLLEDPEGYAATLQRNLEKKLERKNQAVEQQQNQNARYATLTNRFQTLEPELSKENWDVVEFIVTKKVREAQANGINVEALVFANQDNFIKDVAADVKAMVGGRPNEEDDSGTQGLPSAGGISKRTKPAKKQKAPKTFAESFKEVRRSTPGFHNPAAIAK